jgi:hypothetical protein
VSGFRPPIQQAVEEMSQSKPIPGRFLDLLEAIPVSYLVVHYSRLSPESEESVKTFLKDGVSSGRLSLVERFGDATTGDEMFVLTGTESDKAAKTVQVEK